jgi:hypothetical protein
MCWLDVWLSEPAGLVLHIRNQVVGRPIAGVPRFSPDQTNMGAVILLSDRHGTDGGISSSNDCDVHEVPVG